LFVCDDIEKYHTLTLSSLYKLIKDHQKFPNFFPILVSSQPELPDELNKFSYSRIDIGMIEHPEIKQYSKNLYPGIDLSKRVLKQISDTTKGQIPLIYQLFSYLEQTGKIKKANKHFTFIHPKDGDLALPKPGDLVPWYFLKGLNQNERDILFMISLSSGLFTTGEFNTFLISAGFAATDVAESIDRLTKAGLAIVKEYVTSAYPSLKNKFEELMGQRGAYLKDTFVAYTANLYKSGGILNYVLLFTSFFNNGKYEIAFELLASLIKRKIDERNLSGVKAFLSMKNIKLPPNTESSYKVLLRLIQFTGKLRYLFIVEAFDKAEKLVTRIKKSERLIQASEIRGNMFLTLGKYYLAKEDTQGSIGYVKNALLDFEEHGDGSRKAEAYFILTSAMLKDGKLENAVDYLNLAIRLVPDNLHPYEQIQIYALSGITAFMQGNLTKAMFEAERARAICRSTGRRSWELFLTFFVSRIYFEYGLYPDAISALQDCLALITIYSMKTAQPVIYAWLGRNFIYSGDSKTGLKLINELTQNDEVLLFLAEAYYLVSEKEKALEVIKKCNGLKNVSEPHPNETIAWENGYSSIEGKCAKLSDKSGVFSMLKRAYRSYILCLNGMTKEGIGELYNITRVEKSSSADPYTHFYYYLYSLTLQEIKDHEGYDSLTLLNKALKQLQERASKIENPYDRTHYLNNNYWNSRILDAAKKKNLL
jgi:tetratricopeptide (TPR) repeat protein